MFSMTIRIYDEHKLEDFKELVNAGRFEFAETIGIGGIERESFNDMDYSDFTAKESMLQNALQYAVANRYSGFISQRPILSFSTGEIWHAYCKFTFFRLRDKEKELYDDKLKYLTENNLPDLDSNNQTQAISN